MERTCPDPSPAAGLTPLPGSPPAHLSEPSLAALLHLLPMSTCPRLQVHLISCLPTTTIPPPGAQAWGIARVYPLGCFPVSSCPRGRPETHSLPLWSSCASLPANPPRRRQSQRTRARDRVPPALTGSPALG